MLVLAETYTITLYLFDHPLIRVGALLVGALFVFRLGVIVYRLIPLNG